MKAVVVVICLTKVPFVLAQGLHGAAIVRIATETVTKFSGKESFNSSVYCSLILPTLGEVDL